MKAKIIGSFLLTFLLVYTCLAQQPIVKSLNEGWKFSQVGKSEWLKAKVPGTVHEDLITHKKIEDPFYRDNEQKQFWIEKEDWEYRTTFSVANELFIKHNIELVFEGLDTYADVYLNGQLLKKTDNMFVTHIIPCKKYIKSGENELRIYFHSATNEGLAKLKMHPYTVPAANEYAPRLERSSVYSRKAPFHYGWDWGPRIVTCGIWRPVYIKGWDKLKIIDTYHQLASLNKTKAAYQSEIELQATEKAKIKAEIWVNGVKNSEEIFAVDTGINVVKSSFNIVNPKLWWTNGLGKQNTYDVESKLFINDKLIASKKRKEK